MVHNLPMSIAALIVPVVGLLAGAAVGALITWTATSGATAQRERADSRAQWWTQFEASLRLALSDDERKAAAGTILVEQALRSKLAGEDERAAAEAVFHGVLAAGLDMGDSESEEGA